MGTPSLQRYHYGHSHRSSESTPCFPTIFFTTFNLCVNILLHSMGTLPWGAACFSVIHPLRHERTLDGFDCEGICLYVFNFLLPMHECLHRDSWEFILLVMYDFYIILWLFLQFSYTTVQSVQKYRLITGEKDAIFCLVLLFEDYLLFSWQMSWLILCRLCSRSSSWGRAPVSDLGSLINQHLKMIACKSVTCTGLYRTACKIIILLSAVTFLSPSLCHLESTWLFLTVKENHHNFSFFSSL